jgi:hypothetical protein
LKHRTALYTLALLALVALFSVPVLGDSLSQPDPTAQQQTIDAAIGQLFTQTAEAQGQAALTQTIEAAFQQAQTATAVFPTTVQAGFNRALTTTAIATQTVEPTVYNAARVVLQASLPAEAYTSDDLRRAADVISLRLSELGIGGATVEVDPDGGIVVDLPALAETDTAIQAMQEVALLEFVDFSGLGAEAQAYVGRRIFTTEQAAAYERWDTSAEATPEVNPQTGEPFRTVLTGAGIESAAAQWSAQPIGEWQVVFELTPEGAAIFGPFTEEHVGEPLAIVLDGVVLSVPLIQARIDRNGIISGGFTSQEEVDKLAAQLNAGALPIPLRVESVEVVEVTPTASAVASPTVTTTGTPATATPSADLTVTPLPTNFPTPTTAQINVAEQVFEGGRMLWIQPTRQIWVLVVTGTGQGRWAVYEDTFQEGEPESDPSITPPADRLQPTRGFGKLWRENPEVREALGWAVTPEFGYVSPYEYHPGGEIVDGEYVPGPGYHILYSLYGERFRFNESDGTWELG